MPNNTLSELTLYIAPGCPHCPSMLTICCDFVKSGKLARLEIINIAEAMALAQDAGVRSTPYIKVGDFDFIGLHTEKELSEWLDKINSDEGLTQYFEQLFEQGQLEKANQMAMGNESYRKQLINMLVDIDTGLTSRIGITAVFESMQGKQELQSLVPLLCDKLSSEHPSVKVDLCYLLGLSKSPEALPCLHSLENDEFSDVRDAVKDAKETIANLD